MIKRTYVQGLYYVSHFKREPTSGGGISLYGEVEDMGDYVRFSDMEHSYNIAKGGRERHPGDEEPTLDNFDWGNIFKIWAVSENLPFYEDTSRSEDGKKLYFLDNVKNNINNLLNFEGDMIYCGEGKRYVNINPVHCYTGISYIYVEPFVFDVSFGRNCYFI